MSNAAKIFDIPSSALVVLIGVAGSGKSTFANARFRGTEILSSDFFRGLVSDDEGDQEATEDAFALLHLVLEKRLRRGKLCVIDATNIQREYRARLLETGRRFDRHALAVVFQTPEDLCIERAGTRLARIVRASVIHQQAKELVPQTDEDLLQEGFAAVYRFDPRDPVEIRRPNAG